jgi:opacity protein-like surface antigen
VETHSVGGDTLPGSEGELVATTFMFNGFYDFAGLLAEGFTPYVGAGVGYAGVSLEGYSVEGVPEVVDDEDASLTFQAIAGLSYSASERTSLFVEYNYLSTPGIEVDTTLGDNETEIDISSHSVFGGVRYSL